MPEDEAEDFVTGTSFLTTLSFADLQQLREIVRKVYMSNYEVRHVTDYECDKMIDALGPKVLEKEIKRLVDRDRKAGVDGGFLLPDDVPDITEEQSRRRKLVISAEQAARLGGNDESS